MTTTKFHLSNLNCEACGKISKIKLSAIPGVTEVRLNQNGHEASGEVEADRGITVGELQQALEGTEYKIQAI